MTRAAAGNRGAWQVGVASIVQVLGSKTSRRTEPSIKQRLEMDAKLRSLWFVHAIGHGTIGTKCANHILLMNHL